MEIASIRHKGLRVFAETGNAKGIPGNLKGRLRNMLAWLSVIESPAELRIPPNFGAHMLGGDRAGVWALTITRNWRMTLLINSAGQVEELDLEDYH
jgi:toxin HigB-1